MKKYLLIPIVLVVLMGTFNTTTAQIIDKEGIIDSLTTIDKEIRRYFPRWKICEHDLQMQIYTAFITLGYEKEKLNMQDVVILAAPKEYPSDPYDILLIKCGQESMNTIDIESNMGDILIGFLSGQYNYKGPNRGYRPLDGVPERDYCYESIEVDVPLSEDERATIVSYLQPTNVQHAVTLSLFEQAVKIGESGFWLRSKVGTDHVGYHFWSSGEAKIVLQRPLYPNYDMDTRAKIPYLINAYLGGAYRTTIGIGDKNTVLSWVKGRTLNAGPGGKLIGGIDFHLPMHPNAGVNFKAEIPMQGLNTEGIEEADYGYLPRSDVDFNPDDPRYGLFRIEKVAPLLRSTGVFALFYNWWLDEENPENFIRGDFGINYSEVREMAVYRNFDEAVTYMSRDGIEGLNTYKNDEFADWIFAKVEYRNQAAFPFGVSLQLSNQILLGRVYVPVFGHWFYIEGKYATPVRDARPYEIENFFMISPVLRLTI